MHRCVRRRTKVKVEYRGKRVVGVTRKYKAGTNKHQNEAHGKFKVENDT